jgi:NDP-mannose synthase
MAVNHLAELIQAFCNNGSRWGVHIDSAFEDSPLGTMGPLKNVRDLPSDFLIMNGDVLTDLDFAQFYDAHVASGAIFSVSAFTREEVVEYGVLDLDATGTLIGFREKPKLTCTVSMGIYMANRRVLDFIPDGAPFGFDGLMHAFLRSKERVHVRPYSGYWLDIGRPDDYARAVEDFEGDGSVFGIPCT